MRAARGGAIPGAVHLEWTQNLDDKGFFKSADELKQMYAERNIAPDKEVIPYCQGGYRAAHTYLALRLIGYPKSAKLLSGILGRWGQPVWIFRSNIPTSSPN